MFGKKKSVTLLLMRDTLRVASDDSSVIPYLFPEGAVHEMELVDQVVFEKSLQQFFIQTHLTHTVCRIVLDESFLFWKKQDATTQNEDFFRSIPLPLDQLKTKALSASSQHILIGYNSSLLSSVQRVVHATHNSTSSIDIGPLDDQTPLSGVMNGEIISFPKTTPSLLPYVVGVIVVTALLGVVLYPRPTPQVKQVPVPSPVPSPTPFMLDPTDVRIAVVNGSSKFGEAGKLKTILEKEGYSITSIGTAQTDVKETIISPKKSVPASYLIALTNVLSDRYIISTSSSLLNDDATSSADLIITIGTATAQVP